MKAASLKFFTVQQRSTSMHRDMYHSNMQFPPEYVCVLLIKRFKYIREIENAGESERGGAARRRSPGQGEERKEIHIMH